MSNIPFSPVPEPASVAAAPAPDQATEVWNAVMWAYHDQRISPENGMAALGMAARDFGRSYAIWERTIFGPSGAPGGGRPVRAARL